MFRCDIDVRRIGFGRESIVFDLTCREVDVESLHQPLTCLAQNPLTIIRNASHPDMSREEVLTRGQAPGMNMVYGPPTAENV
jgi:hypothetical protein